MFGWRPAAKALGEIGDPCAIEGLTEAALRCHASERQGAWYSLRFSRAKRGDYSPVELLIKALRDDENPEVRRNAAKGLGYFGNPRAVEVLVNALRDDENPEVRIDAAEGLREFQDPRACEALIDALRDENPALRQSPRRTSLRGGMDVADWQPGNGPASKRPSVPSAVRSRSSS
jgi:HEAT repeat protein